MDMDDSLKMEMNMSKYTENEARKKYIRTVLRGDGVGKRKRYMNISCDQYLNKPHTRLNKLNAIFTVGLNEYWLKLPSKYSKNYRFRIVSVL